MKYADLKLNDIVNCPNGICVSLWMQGCPFHCKGCHNQQTWDFSGGKEIEFSKLLDNIIESIPMYGVTRQFSILGGEPLCLENSKYIEEVIKCVRENFKNIVITIWTGYTLEELKLRKDLVYILNNVDYLIDGPFMLELRDITLRLRGSSNQRIFKNVSKNKSRKAKFKEVTNDV